MRAVPGPADYPRDMASSSVPSAARIPWFPILIALALVDLVTVWALVASNERLLRVSQEVGTSSQQWTARQTRLATLRHLAHEVMVDTSQGDAERENSHVGNTIAAFIEASKAVGADLASIRSPKPAVFESELNAISQAVDTMASHRLAAIRYQRGREYDRAAHETAAAVSAMSALDLRFKELEAVVEASRSAVAAEQQEAAYNIRRIDLAIAGLNLLPIVACVLARSRPVSPAALPARREVEAATVSSQPVPVPPAAAPPPSPVPPAPLTVDRNDLTGELDEFPSELDAEPWRRAG